MSSNLPIPLALLELAEAACDGVEQEAADRRIRAAMEVSTVVAERLVDPDNDLPLQRLVAIYLSTVAQAAVHAERGRVGDPSTPVGQVLQDVAVAHRKLAQQHLRGQPPDWDRDALVIRDAFVTGDFDRAKAPLLRLMAACVVILEAHASGTPMPSVAATLLQALPWGEA